MKEALLWDPLDELRVQCRLCAHGCIVRPGKVGLCGVRENRDGRLYSLVYGRAVAANLDPIEKKPLFHFLPGSTSLSIATAGCNFACDHCQNHVISQMPRNMGRIEGDRLSPEQVVAAAQRQGAASISYTYTEPTIYFEYALDTARLASAAGLKNVFVTNGYMTADCLDMIGSDLHAANVDLKAFSNDFYQSVCKAKVEPVKASIAKMKHMGVWVEVTTLLIPGLNDDDAELTRLAQWLAGVGPDIPWHISRFHPTYRLTEAPPTPAESIHRARKIGLAAGLTHVYTGNIRGDDGERTFCGKCRELLIDRVGFVVRKNLVQNGQCPHCGAPVNGIWS